MKFSLENFPRLVIPSAARNLLFVGSACLFSHYGNSR